MKDLKYKEKYLNKIHKKPIKKDILELEISRINFELCSFDGTESDATKGKHDDIVDSFSSAINFYYINDYLYPNYI